MSNFGTNLDALIPVAMVLSIASVIIAAIHYKYRGRRDLLKTIERSLHNNPQLDAAAIKAIADSAGPKRKDLRRGMILIGIALSGSILGVTLGHTEMKTLLALSAFPAILGLIYLTFHVVDSRARQV